MNVTKPTSGYLEAGWYPDALIPHDKYLQRHNKISVEIGKNQGITIKIKTKKIQYQAFTQEN